MVENRIIMKHIYKVTEMHCGSCEAKVKSSLLMFPNVTEIELSKRKANSQYQHRYSD